MQQYLNLIKNILTDGTKKSSGRAGMPDTISLFGYQMKFNLADGFPLLTTKKVSLKNVATELIWFLRGDSNIKYLVDNGCNIWNEDAYNYYCKLHSQQNPSKFMGLMSFDDFVVCVQDKNQNLKNAGLLGCGLQNYTIGDTGEQYPRLWRSWKGEPYCVNFDHEIDCHRIDQISNLIDGLKKNPEGRRHIITAWNPATLNDMALNACHVFVQFNCSKISIYQRIKIFYKENPQEDNDIYEGMSSIDINDSLSQWNIPEYYLDCSFYQRSADTMLGVPYNIASYALLTHLICRMLNMVPGNLIHSLGDVHIYENHLDAASEQLSRAPVSLPKIIVLPNHKDYGSLPDSLEKWLTKRYTLSDFFDSLIPSDFRLEGYDAKPLENETKLSTGLS